MSSELLEALTSQGASQGGVRQSGQWTGTLIVVGTGIKHSAGVWVSVVLRSLKDWGAPRGPPSAPQAPCLFQQQNQFCHSQKTIIGELKTIISYL